MAADDVSRAVAQGAPHLGAVEVVRPGERVEGVVEQHVALAVDQRNAQLLEGPFPARREDGRFDAVVQRVEHPEVDQLQVGIEPFGLEMPFAAVLEKHETGYQCPEEHQQQQEKLPVVGEPNL